MRKIKVTHQQYTDAKLLAEFTPKSEMQAILSGCRNEEKAFFFDKIEELATRIRNMPATYGQSESTDPTAYLHYFNAGMNFYITEKDINADGEGQHQAFGLADMGFGSELGYISIIELTENDVELDLYFDPKQVSTITKKG